MPDGPFYTSFMPTPRDGRIEEAAMRNTVCTSERNRGVSDVASLVATLEVAAI